MNDYEIGRLLNTWTINDVGESLMDIEGFELYINIARFFRKKTPESQIKEEVFLKYRTQKPFENKVVNKLLYVMLCPIMFCSVGVNIDSLKLL